MHVFVALLQEPTWLRFRLACALGDYD